MDERELPDTDPAPGERGQRYILPDPGFPPDLEWDAYVAWREREIAAGRERAATRTVGDRGSGGLAQPW